jgi:uncharacterized membrane protein YedE/YeeE
MLHSFACQVMRFPSAEVMSAIVSAGRKMWHQLIWIILFFVIRLEEARFIIGMLKWRFGKGEVVAEMMRDSSEM